MTENNTINVEHVLPGETVYFNNLPVNEMDEECIDLCIAMNNLPGVETIESCFGHFRDAFRIFFRCSNFKSLGILARVFDRRYSNTSKIWSITVETSDIEPCNLFMLSSNNAYEDHYQLKEDLHNIIENIKYWSDNKFKDYFKEFEYGTRVD